MTSTSAEGVSQLNPLVSMMTLFSPSKTDSGHSFSWAMVLASVTALVLSSLLIATAPPIDSGTATQGPSEVAIRFQPLPLPVEEPKPPIVEPAPKSPVVPEVVKEPVPTPPEPIQPQEQVSPSTAAEPPKPETPPRRVYGVRKIMAQGLGSGSDGSPGLVSKIGNTVDGRMDDRVATENDLTGTLVASSSVDQAPVPVRRTKPEYSELMTEHRAEGTVTARLLIDIDGKVKDVEVLSDFGLDSPDVARRAFLRFTFKPAIQDGTPVAVWITHKIRFEFEE